jgi:hypothetical protein
MAEIMKTAIAVLADVVVTITVTAIFFITGVLMQ